MRKFIYIGFMVLIGAFLLAQCPPGSPEYLYRCLDMSCYEINNLGGLSTCDTMPYVESKLIDWYGANANNAEGYHYSNGVNDDLYGYFSMPVRVIGDTVVLDSVLLCFYTADGPDKIEGSTLRWRECDGTDNMVATLTESGDGNTGWEWTNVAFGDSMVEDSVCYYFHIDCTNDGANDIRVRNCTHIYYHIK